MLSFQYFSRGECLPDVTLEGQPSNSRSLSARSDPVIKRSSFSCHSLLPYSLTARVGSLSSVALFGLHLQYGIIFVGYSHLHGLFFITIYRGRFNSFSTSKSVFCKAFRSVADKFVEFNFRAISTFLCKSA